jgi:hypothetical protein
MMDDRLRIPLDDLRLADLGLVPPRRDECYCDYMGGICGPCEAYEAARADFERERQELARR